jgi:hypothetical protein
MTEQDYEAFGNELKRLSSALDRYAPKGDDMASKVDAYFHALKKYPLSEVIAKADRWLEKEKKFPAPAEWASVIVSRSQPLPVLTPAEAREYHAAELARWEQPPCGCGTCVAARIEQKPLRFVPDLDRDDRDIKAIDPANGRVVSRGHWAHGWELARWYEARANFHNACLERGLRGDVLRPRPGKARPKADMEALVTP